MNIDKWKFFLKEVTFFGHIISTEGLKIYPEKIKTVQTFKTPSKMKEVQSYLGFLNFYQKYVKDFANIIQPLIELTKINNKWKWEKKHQEAFDKSKEAFFRRIRNFISQIKPTNVFEHRCIRSSNRGRTISTIG